MADNKLKQQIPISKEARKLAILEAQKAKEKMYKLLVKIISWESGSLESVVIQAGNKITPTEWLQYKKHRMGISTTLSEEETENKLVHTYKSIKENGGFE